jgi:hypothetical protein
MKEHLQRHALSYTIAALLGFTAGFVAVYDNFWPLEPSDMARLGWWQVVAIAAKCVAAASTAIVGYLIKSPVQKPLPGETTTTTRTTPPIPLSS